MPTVRSTDFSWAFNEQGRGGPQFQFAKDASRCVAPIQLENYFEISQAVQDFVGWSRIQPTPTGQNYISRETPYAFPGITDVDSLKWLFAVGVQSSEGIGARGQYPSGMPQYEKVRLWMIFNMLTYRIRDDTDPLVRGQEGSPLEGYADEGRLNRYVTKIMRPFTRVVTLPQSLFYWVREESSDPQFDAQTPSKQWPVLEGIGKVESGMELVYIHHERPDLPVGRFLDGIGTVNSVAFDGWPAGSLLAEPPEVKPQVSVIGDSIWDISFRFKILFKRRRKVPYATPAESEVVGWNYQPRFLPATNTTAATYDYRLITTTGLADGKTIFDSSDFSNFFRPDPP